MITLVDFSAALVCDWKADSDGDGDEETLIGEYLSAAECANQCMARTATNSTINGATRRKSDGKCWCEMGMTAQVASDVYNSCYFTGKKNV